MKYLRIAATIATLAIVAPIAGGCQGGGILEKMISSGVNVLTSSIKNPLNNNAMAAAETAVGTVRTGVLFYIELPRCSVGQVFSVLNPCSQNSIVRQFKLANRTVQFAMVKARQFHKDYPDVDVTDVLKEVYRGIDDFNAMKAKYGVI